MKIKLETYEANVSSDMQLTSAMGLVSFVEVSFAHTRLVHGSSATKCTHNFEVRFENVRCLPESIEVAPMRVLSVDIETATHDFKTSNPDVDCIFQISACLRDAFTRGDERIEKHLFALEVCDLGGEEVDFQLHVCPTEMDLLLSFAQLVSSADPDLMTGWNTDG